MIFKLWSSNYDNHTEEQSSNVIFRGFLTRIFTTHMQRLCLSSICPCAIMSSLVKVERINKQKFASPHNAHRCLHEIFIGKRRISSITHLHNHMFIHDSELITTLSEWYELRGRIGFVHLRVRRNWPHVCWYNDIRLEHCSGYSCQRPWSDPQLKKPLRLMTNQKRSKYRREYFYGFNSNQHTQVKRINEWIYQAEMKIGKGRIKTVGAVAGHPL